MYNCLADNDLADNYQADCLADKCPIDNSPTDNWLQMAATVVLLGLRKTSEEPIALRQ